MKKYFLLFFVLTFSLSIAYAQGSLQLFDHAGNYITNGQRVAVYVEDINESDIVSEDYFIRNNSDEDISIKCVRTVITAVEGSANAFCTFGLCYSPDLDESPNSTLIPANTTAANNKPFSSHYYPNGYAGTSEIAYKFYNVDDPNDSISFSVQFSDIAVTKNSLQLFDSEGNEMTYGFNTEVNVEDLSVETGSPEYFIRNNSNRELNLMCERTVLENIEGSMNYFCALGTCLPPTGDLAGPKAIPANTTTGNDPFSTHYNANDSVGMTKIHYRYFDQNNEFDEFSFTVTFDGRTGINSILNSQADISATPNPATNYIILNVQSLDIAHANLMIYNAVGELVMVVPSIDESSHTIDVSALNAGIYLYRLEGDQKMSKTSKLLIQ